MNHNHEDDTLIEDVKKIKEIYHDLTSEMHNIKASQESQDKTMIEINKTLGRIILIEERQLNSRQEMETMNARFNNLVAGFEAERLSCQRTHVDYENRLVLVESASSSTSKWVERGLLVLVSLGLAGMVFAVAVFEGHS